jgi:signal transduction histidine kinase
MPFVTNDNAIGALLDAAPCGFVTFADDGTIRALNTTLLTILGAERDELIGRRIETILNVGTRIFYQTHFFPLLKLHGRADEIFLLLRANSGADIAVLANAIRRERGGEWVTDCVLLQVHERQKFEDALLRAKKVAEDARAAADEQRRHVEAANEQLERQALELELIQQHLSEQTHELESQGDELRALNDALVERSEELERLRSVADEANRAKSSFLAMMSHELRTPLNAIGGYVQLLEMGIHGPVTEAQADALGRVTRSQRHLLRLINEVLNLARIEAGRVDYDLEVCDLRKLVDAVLPMVEPQLLARRHRHEVNIAAGLAVYADWDKVQQILLNLLSNATKFTPNDGLVSVDGFVDDARDDRVSIRVRDTGVGIPADRLEHVFEPFVQVDDSHARRSEGTGLGLAISRDLARGMGGDLTAHSEAGVGSSFTLTLPRASPGDSG